MDPIDAAFEEFVSQVFWVESLEEAVSLVEEFIREMDRDLREVLLERRKTLCSNDERIASNLKAAAMALLLEDDEDFEVRVLALEVLLSQAFLMQCTPSWSKLDPRSKASILAPLYRASYALKLASKDGDARLLDEARRMLGEAYSSAQKLGVLEELEELAKRVLESTKGGGGGARAPRRPRG